ncbi:MAG: hypothetical protein M1438_04400 [Deltaproteobacteria bacterium]|nr:hypothetical protein [Deltaproteobacteria bacterium]
METEFHRQTQLAGDLRQEMEKYLFAALRDVFTDWRRQEIDKLALLLADTHQEFAPGRRGGATPGGNTASRRFVNRFEGSY